MQINHVSIDNYRGTTDFDSQHSIGYKVTINLSEPPGADLVRTIYRSMKKHAESRNLRIDFKDSELVLLLNEGDDIQQAIDIMKRIINHIDEPQGQSLIYFNSYKNPQAGFISSNQTDNLKIRHNQ